MECTVCHAVLATDAQFCSKCGTRVERQAVLQVDQEVGKVQGDLVGTTITSDLVDKGLISTTRQKITTVERGGTVVGSVVGGSGPTHVGGQQHYGDTVAGDKRAIDTGGGSYVEGNDTRQGIFGGQFAGPAIGVNTGTANFGSVTQPPSLAAPLMQLIEGIHEAQAAAHQAQDTNLADDLDGILQQLTAAAKAQHEDNPQRYMAKLQHARDLLNHLLTQRPQLQSITRVLEELTRE